MIPILTLLQTSITLYMAILTVIWIIIQFISRTDTQTFTLIINRKSLLIMFIIYMFTAILFINIDVYYFPYLHAIMYAFTLAIVLGSSNRSSRFLSFIVFMVALMPVIVMISTRHPLPLGDDARFIGFAKAIAVDGRWVPFKYRENTYYQFFHLIPYLEYILATIPGYGLNNIMAYYLTLKLYLYFTYLASVYLVVRKLTGNMVSSLVAVLLLSITPPLALTQVVHQGYAIVLFLITSLLLLREFEDRQSYTNILAMYPLIIAGLIAHATYTVMLMAFFIPFLMRKRFSNSIKPSRIVEFLVILIAISLAYWTYIYVLDIIIRPTVNAITRLVDILTGRPYTLFQGTAKPWYTSQISVFFLSWALIPAITASTIFFLMISKLKRANNWKYLEMLGLLGLVGVALSYILRTVPAFGGRYFYWTYLLMLPLSALVVSKSSKKVVSFASIVLLISIVSFYGIQDPTLSANTYGDYIGWADRTSWSISKDIASYISPQGTISWLDPRLGAPLSGLKIPPTKQTFKPLNAFAVIGMDNIGLRAVTKDPRNVDFFNKWFNIVNFGTITKNEIDIVFSCKKYLGMWRRL